MLSTIRIVAASLIVVAFCMSSWAQEAPAAPDRSKYNLFNPTPDDSLRDFNPDRPTKATSPYTIDGGRFQLETDFALYTYDRANADQTTQRTWNVLDPNLRIGLTSEIELDIMSSGFYNNVKTTNQTSGASQTNQGFGDITLGGKFNLMGNDDDGLAFAVVPQVKFPTAASGVGNGAYEGALLLPVAFPLPLDFTFTLTPQFSALKNASDSGHHAAFSQIVNLSRPIVDGLIGFLEFFASESAETGGQNAYTFDTALAYIIAPNIQLDIGTNIGLNRAAPDVQGYFGLTKRF